jgi:hypothetical protein
MAQVLAVPQVYDAPISPVMAEHQTSDAESAGYQKGYYRCPVLAHLAEPALAF